MFNSLTENELEDLANEDQFEAVGILMRHNEFDSGITYESLFNIMDELSLFHDKRKKMISVEYFNAGR